MIPCDFFGEKTLILGVGSPLRSDDQAGLVLCDILNQNGVECLKCEYGVENCLDVIIERSPERLLIFDAALFSGGSPGDLVYAGDLEVLDGVSLLTTHNIPLKLVLDLIRSSSPVREIRVVGIYPKNLDIGVSISNEVMRAISTLVESILKCFKRT